MSKVKFRKGDVEKSYCNECGYSSMAFPLNNFCPYGHGRLMYYDPKRDKHEPKKLPTDLLIKYLLS